MKLILATGNKNKIREIRAMLGDLFDDVIPMGDLGFNDDIVEDGKNFYENSLIKAKTVSDYFNMPALGDDTGLCIDALNGEPGIYSARYATEGHDDSKNIDKVLKKLEGVENRTAHFETCMVIYFPDGKIIQSIGKTEGHITRERHGNNGFGYDPIFYSNDLNKVFGDCTLEEKNSVSHRGRALKNLKEIIKNL